jgi:hypothetical protein
MNPLATAEFFIAQKQGAKAKQVLDLMKPYCQTVQQMDACGKLYSDIREFNDALELGLKIYTLASSNEMRWNARVNVIRSYLNLNKPLEALTYIDINEKVNPSDHPNMMDKAMALFLLNRKPEGEAILRKILTEPRSEDIDFRVKFNLGTYDITNGNFKEGMKHVLLDGRRLNIWETYTLPKEKYWQGGIQPGKTILLCAEGGIGDEIINVRFQKHFIERGMKPIWYTSNLDLAKVFNRCGFETVTDLSVFKPDWLWTYSMLVPVFLDLTEEDLWDAPYLTARTPRLRVNKVVGIKYSGNPKYDQDLHRNIPFDELINAIPENYTILSMQLENDIPHPRVTPMKYTLKSWDDTLNLMSGLDLVISSCTSTAHAAGALGIETKVLVPILNYYTWANPTNTSKWYGPNLKILRQQEYDNWRAPLAELKASL